MKESEGPPWLFFKRGSEVSFTLYESRYIGILIDFAIQRCRELETKEIEDKMFFEILMTNIAGSKHSWAQEQWADGVRTVSPTDQQIDLVGNPCVEQLLTHSNSRVRTIGQVEAQGLKWVKGTYPRDLYDERRIECWDWKLSDSTE